MVALKRSAEPAPLSAYIDNSRSNNFNLLRLVSAVAVIYGHAFALSLNPNGQTEVVKDLVGFTYSGALAVDVFFLISGMFVTQSLYHERTLLGFALKRFFRIWPGLVVCLIVSAGMATLVSTAGFTSTVENPLTYLYVLRNSILRMQWTIPGVFEHRTYAAINGSLWTLPLEAKMYLIVLAAGILGFLSSRLALVGLSVVLAVTLLLFPEKYAGFLGSTSKEAITPVLFFFAGMAVFAVRDSIRLRARHIIFVAILATFVGSAAFEVIFYVLVGMVALRVGCSDILRRVPRPRGDYSYGVYIYGFPSEQLVTVFWPAALPYEMFALAMIIVFPLAIASWHLVELPAQRVGKSVSHFLADWRPADCFKVAPILQLNWRGIALPLAALAIAAIGFKGSEAALAIRPAGELQVGIIGFGPSPVAPGKPFNVQPNGESAIWVKLSHAAEPDYTLQMESTDLPTVVNEDLLTAAVPARLFAEKGSLALRVKTVRNGRFQLSPPVAFVVQ